MDVMLVSFSTCLSSLWLNKEENCNYFLLDLAGAELNIKSRSSVSLTASSNAQWTPTGELKVLCLDQGQYFFSVSRCRDVFDSMPCNWQPAHDNRDFWHFAVIFLWFCRDFAVIFRFSVRQYQISPKSDP